MLLLHETLRLDLKCSQTQAFASAFHFLFTAAISTLWLRQHNRQHKVIGRTFSMGLNKQAIGQRHLFCFIRKCYLALMVPI